MAGGLLQLVAYGSENQYLNGNPQLSFFKMVYRRFTNFAMQSIEVFFKGIDYLNYNESTILKTTVPRNADLFSNMFLCLDMPNIYANKDLQFRWIEQLGAIMIKEVKILCGGTVIEKIDGEYISIYHNTHMGKEKTEIFDKLSGNVPEHYNPVDQYSRYNSYSQIPFDISTSVMDPPFISRGYNTRPTIIGKRLYIPLPFWFHRNVGQAVPLIALQYHEIQVEIELRPIKDLYVVGRDTIFDMLPSYAQDGTTQIEPSNNSLHYLRWSRPIAIEDEIGNFTNNGTNTWKLKPTLEINYIFLDDKERTWFAENSHEFLVEKVFIYEELGRRSYTNIELEAYHPVKELIITARRDDVRKRNQWSNYTIRDTLESNPYLGQSYYLELCRQVAPNYPQYNSNPIIPLGIFRTDKNRLNNLLVFDQYNNNINSGANLDIANILTNNNPIGQLAVNRNSAYTIDEISSLIKQWEFRDPSDIPIINSQNYSYYTDNIISDIELLFNGNIRLDRKKVDYFDKVQPLVHHANSGLEGVLYYSFAIEPDKFQPSGSCNFSHIKNINLNINYKNPADFETGIYRDILFDLKVYFVGYNLFRIMGGMGSLAFGN